ncbi:PEGA domain-containing protein [Cyclonatronum proteinivorum]|uniref:PEGA domain-containing protein n=1 Tax=Cyclonatronum proteinivorum TaxID=1457365 RepID=A0A345UHJ1_9BACT|nr:FHA domain-containing protein [Cyclonatronum proteinivorum]AXI99942.1 PEGA domain-containing protein [Cyclonatronum proteinivorum]
MNTKIIAKYFAIVVVWLFVATDVSAQTELNIQDLQNNISRYLDRAVIIEGVVDQHIDDVGDLGAYVVRDRFNDVIRVRTSDSKPPLNTTLRISGIFTEGAAIRGERTFFVLESSREFTDVGGSTVMLTLNSNPSGATIIMNGVMQGTTPANLILPQDRNVMLQLQKNFYNDKTISVVTRRDNIIREVKLTRSGLYYVATFLGIGLILALIGIVWFATKDTSSGGSGVTGSTTGGNRGEGGNRGQGGNSVRKPTDTEDQKPSVVENKTVKMNVLQGRTVKVRRGYFSVLEGISEPKELRLYIDPKSSANEYTFGRDDINSVNHFQLKDMTVSRKQAVLVVENNGPYTIVNNAKSDSNPTKVNDEEMAPYESRALNHGDIVQMGNVKLEFRLK